MKKFFNWQVVLGLILIILSAVVYSAHYFIFRDPHHIFIYMVGDIGFAFLEVLLVTLVLHRLLHYRERKSMLNKLNMVIGVFFSEVGTELLKTLSIFDDKAEEVTKKLIISADWSKKDFISVVKELKAHKYGIDSKKASLDNLRIFLEKKRNFLVNLLENSNLLEHESFTDLLWAVFHLTEELTHRKQFDNLPDADHEHLSGDMERACSFLTVEWVNYMFHLKESYPYLFSLAIRTNPFDGKARVELT